MVLAITDLCPDHLTLNMPFVSRKRECHLRQGLVLGLGLGIFVAVKFSSFPFKASVINISVQNVYYDYRVFLQ